MSGLHFRKDGQLDMRYTSSRRAAAAGRLPPTRSSSTARAPKTGVTVVCDGERCVFGNFKPTQKATAHQRLVRAARMEDPVVAGAIKKDGTIALRSESINRRTTGGCGH